MAKKTKKMLALVLTGVLCAMNVAPALAEDVPAAPAPAASEPAPAPAAPAPAPAAPAPVSEASSSTTETNDKGQTVTTTTTEKTTTDENTGKVTVEVTVHEKITSDPADPVQVEREETTTNTTVSDENGKTVAEYEVIEGSQVTTTTEEDNGDEPGQPEVTVPLVPGETTVGEAITSSTTIGDPQKSENDPNYSSITKEEIDRTVEATTSEGEIKVEVEGTSELKPLVPDRSIDDDGDLKDEQLLKEYTYSGGFNDYPVVEAPEGFDYRFTGFGQMSMFGNAIETSAGKDSVTGALQFELEYDPSFVPGSADNKVIDEDEKFVAYCADIDTDGKDNWWYRVDNLEDAGYYDEEAAEYIRAIASNGYWGTSNEKDEEGNYQMGSLAKLKEDMKAAVRAGSLTGITEEEIDSLTEGQAVNATQSAIWMYANETTDGSKVDTDRLIGKGFAKNKAERVEPSEEDVRNVKAIFNYLMGLDPVSSEGSTEIIDADSFIKEDSMSITVGDKVSNHASNKDNDKNNDVYNVAVNFALVVTPSKDGDDLIVQVVSVDADGNTTVTAKGRIAGDSSNDEGFNEVEYNEATGEYSMKGLSLAENSDFSFDLKLSGTQYLQEGVYIFTSEERNGETSQTFVSMAGGDKEVNVSQSFVVNFDMDENNYSRETRRWKKSSSSNKPGKGGGNGGGVPGISLVVTYNDPTPEEDAEEALVILDEEVPLAAAPETGDNSIIFAIMSMLSLMGMAVLAKKRVQE